MFRKISFSLLNSKTIVKLVILFALIASFSRVEAQSSYELNSGWHCAPIANVKEDGFKISNASYNTSS
jgi:mannosylglycoprotein endo-beta-mannosidase